MKTNPSFEKHRSWLQQQNLVEYIVRQKIYDSLYWKQDCFGLTAERIVDKAVDVRFIGGMYGEPQKPTDFICLILKMLQIQPDKQIILEFIKNDDFKYLRVLGAFYLRLVGKAIDVFNYLEPLLNDYRRVRVRGPDGKFALRHIDELVDEMLRTDYMFDIALPRLPPRQSLEKMGQLEPRVSVLEEEFEEEVRKEQEEQQEKREEEEGEEEGEHRRSRKQREKWQILDNDREERKERRRTKYSSDEEDRYHHSQRHQRNRKRGRYDDDEVEEGEHRGGGGGGKSDALSIEETNKLRASLGLPPLKP